MIIGNDNYNGGLAPLYSDIIKRAKNLIASAESDLAMNGKVPSSVYIFRSKNYEGLKDQQEVVVAPKQDLEPENVEEIMKELPSGNE